MTDPTALSRTVAYALRHQPWRFGLELDDAGWVPLDDLAGALRAEPRWRSVTRADLLALVAAQTKQRYEVDGDRIRAAYGHSVPARIAAPPGVPPDVLFHGTAAAVVPAIRAAGLLPMGRQYVHLSADRSIARAVGRRKSPQVAMLVVDARGAHAAGVTFRLGNGAVWLADHVPPAFVEVAPS
jgi:putative RNA 2'-phosphotransferase